MSLADRLYSRLPTWGQHAAVTAYGLYWHQLRFGPGYRHALHGYLDRERWDGSRWAEWTKAELRRLLVLAAETVPYYADTWSASEKRAARSGRLDGLPFLEKDPLRSSPRAFVRQAPQGRRRRRELVFHTSGSTGTPIASIWTVDELRASLAQREARSARWAGTSFQRPRATFSGRIVVPNAESSGPFHRWNAVERQVYFSAFHLSSQTAHQYVEALHRHRIEWLTGYAVSFHLLARFMLERGIEPPPLRAVITTSEKLTVAMRSTMEEAYRCPIFEEYSTVENAVFASECDHGSLHVSPDAGVVEILAEDGSPCRPGEVGEVVATCLSRTHQPLIRFRLGDLAAWSDEACPCGRSMPRLKEVVGRLEDVVVGPDGREMVRFHGVWVGLSSVVEGQIVQRALDHIVARVVPGDGFGRADEAEIQQRIRQRLGPEVRVEIERRTVLPRTAAGKVRAVISELRRPDGSSQRSDEPR